MKSRRMRWARRVVCKGDRGGVFKVLVGKRPPGKSRRRWEYNIKMELQEIGCGGID
jgi:hypothetical protein